MSADRLATVTAALDDAYDYLSEMLAPCDPDCECLLHRIEQVLGKPDSRTQMTPAERARWDLERTSVGRVAHPSSRCAVLGDAADPRTRCIFVDGHGGEHVCPEWPTRLQELEASTR